MQAMVLLCSSSCRAVLFSVFTTFLFCAAVSTQLKGHPNIGPQLFSMFQQAGLVDVRVRCVQPIFTADNEGHAVARITLQDIREQVVHNNLATDAELDELSQELAALEATPGSIVSLPRIFQVTGRAEAAT
eukprot:TRINITY_DN9926_c0_g1_i3.p1 TRINITY_DN9926_c0_g1~~TRINITY_DN9926_c0_g1_i3.p1  ORF type:complete len:131 (+),score=30.95 TRINITY_DN9926_c0_g1_i3:62-454(+)